MMVRVQITIDPEMQRRVREQAAQLGISFAEYVRRVLARELAGPPREADPSVVFNLGRSEGADVALDKDRYVGEAMVAERARDDSGR